METKTDLQFLGCGAAFNPLEKNTNAYFELADTLFLVDCGESAFESVYKKGLFDGKKAVAVLISHLHADHVGSLGSLISYAAYVLHIPVHVIHPEDTITKLLDLLGIKKDCYTYSNNIPENYAAELKVRFYPVKHVDNMKCFGYTVETPHWSVYFSGDATAIPSEVLELLKTEKICKIYQDTCSKTSGHATHCSLAELEKQVPPDLRCRVYCMHLDMDFTAEIKKSGFQYVRRSGN